MNGHVTDKRSGEMNDASTTEQPARRRALWWAPVGAAGLVAGILIGVGISWGMNERGGAAYPSNPTVSQPPAPPRVGLVRVEQAVVDQNASLALGSMNGGSANGTASSGTATNTGGPVPVAGFLDHYLTALSEGRPKDAWAMYTPALQKKNNPYDRWAAGYSTTVHRDARMLSLTKVPDGRVVTRVWMVSDQDPAHSPDLKSRCLTWDLTYVLVPKGTSWLISEVRKPKSGKAYQPCPAPAHATPSATSPVASNTATSSA